MAAHAQLLAWITCDGIHIDPITGKHTLLGVFSTLHASQFPVVHPRMIWFLAITDVPEGNHQMTASIGTQDESLKPLVTREFESKSPAQRINLINDIQNLRFEHSDNYTIVIDIDERTLLATTLPIVESS
jgi:hypothetical protein